MPPSRWVRSTTTRQTHCNTLHHTHCNTLQRQRKQMLQIRLAAPADVGQCEAMSCRVLRETWSFNQKICCTLHVSCALCKSCTLPKSCVDTFWLLTRRLLILCTAWTILSFVAGPVCAFLLLYLYFCRLSLSLCVSVPVPVWSYFNQSSQFLTASLSMSLRARLCENLCLCLQDGADNRVLCTGGGGFCGGNRSSSSMSLCASLCLCVHVRLYVSVCLCVRVWACVCKCMQLHEGSTMMKHYDVALWCSTMVYDHDVALCYSTVK